MDKKQLALSPVNFEPMSWERVVPDVLDPQISFQRNILNQHLERYYLAAKFVSGKQVIDAACGSGYGSELLYNAGARNVIGLDIDQKTLTYATERYGNKDINFIHADLESYNFSSFTPEIFVSFETIEHLTDPKLFLTRVHNCLSPDGFFIGSVPTVPTVDIDEFHKHDFTENSWRALVNSCGFNIVEELPQHYRATLAELTEEKEATNTIVGVRQNQGRYYLRHPLQWLRRYTRLLLFGLELDMLTLVCRPK